MESQQPHAAEQHRRLVSDYRTLTNHAKQSKDVLSRVDGNQLYDVIRQSDVLQGKAQVAKEHAVDTELFSHLADCSLEAAKKLAQCQPGRQVADLIVALKTNYVHGSNPQQAGQEDPHAMDWHELGAKVASLYKAAPGVQCMRGPLDARPRERKVTVRKAKTTLGELVRPEELQQITEEDKQETDRNMETMWNIVKDRQAVPVAELTLNFNSFSQTVENLFTLAFLVRDGRVAMYHEEATGLGVRPVAQSKGDNQKARGEAPQQRQFIVSFHMNDWHMMKELVGADGCLMPHREQPEAAERVLGRKANRAARVAAAQAAAAAEAAEQEAGAAGLSNRNAGKRQHR